MAMVAFNNRCPGSCTARTVHLRWVIQDLTPISSKRHRHIAMAINRNLQTCSTIPPCFQRAHYHSRTTRPISTTGSNSSLGPTDSSDPHDSFEIVQPLVKLDPTEPWHTPRPRTESPTPAAPTPIRPTPIPLTTPQLPSPLLHPVNTDLEPVLIMSEDPALTLSTPSQPLALDTPSPTINPFPLTPDSLTSVLPSAHALARAAVAQLQAQVQHDLAPRAAALAEAVANMQADLPPQAAALAESITQLQKDLHQQAVVLSTPPHAEVTPPGYEPAFEDLPPTAGGEHLHRSNPGSAFASLFQLLWDKAYQGVMLFLAFGAVVIAGLISWSSGTVQSRASPYTFTVHIAEAPGVHRGVAVNLQGVQVGRVISVQPKVQHVCMEVEVNNANTHIPLGSRIDFNVHGMFSQPGIDLVLPAGMNIKALNDARSPRDVEACKAQGLLVCQGGIVEGKAGGSTDEMLQRFVRKHRKEQL